MGILKDLYDNMINGTLTKEEKETLHKAVISQHQKDDTPAGLYTPESCPCDFGICDECTIMLLAPERPTEAN